MSKKGILVLENGDIFEGIAAGASATKVGELCFNTGMTGYQELFTDPSYYGQMLVMTSNHIGNYGTMKEDEENPKTSIFGMISREFSDKASRAKSSDSLQQYFEKHNVPALHNVDTRKLVQIIRRQGAMNAILTTEDKTIEELQKELAEAPKMKGSELSSKVCTQTPYELGSESANYKIAVYDFGVKQNILNCFLARNCHLRVFPARTPISEVLAWNPQGIFLSKGPGDPASMDYAIENTKVILEKNIPTFGICLGQQILALAAGASTYKLHYGHRGLNHPVKNLINQKSEITSQNHGFVVDEESLKLNSNIEITHINLNDNTIEGIRIKGKKAFSVQYHPESSPGPHDSGYLFDEFLEML
jgi:carbamoyl-phosphate synthase small subunit